MNLVIWSAFCFYPQGPQPMLFSKSTKDPSLKLPVDKAVGTSRDGRKQWERNKALGCGFS